MMTETNLNIEVLEVLDEYEKLLSGYASRARAMITNHGNIIALSKLVTSPNLQYGFKKLRDNGMLERYSFEALVVKYACLFSADVVKAAEWRLAHPDDLL